MRLSLRLAGANRLCRPDVLLDHYAQYRTLSLIEINHPTLAARAPTPEAPDKPHSA